MTLLIFMISLVQGTRSMDLTELTATSQDSSSFVIADLQFPSKQRHYVCLHAPYLHVQLHQNSGCVIPKMEMLLKGFCFKSCELF